MSFTELEKNSKKSKVVRRVGIRSFIYDMLRGLLEILKKV